MVVVCLAAPITYLQVARPTVEDVQQALRIHSSTSVVEPKEEQTATSKSQPSVVPTQPIVKPTPAPPVTKPVSKTATTNSFVNVRGGKSVSTPIIARLEAGTTIELRSDADTTWQGVIYQGKPGYIYRSYIQY